LGGVHGFDGERDILLRPIQESVFETFDFAFSSAINLVLWFFSGPNDRAN